METIKVAFFTHQTPDSPLEHLRVIGPISHTNINLIMGPELKQNIQSNIVESDLIIVQRTFPADYKTFNEILDITRRLKKPLIYDFDDNLFLLPENHPDRKTFGVSRALLPMLFAATNADFITVSNDHLKKSFKDLNENIFVLPNYLDDSIWSLIPPQMKHDKKQLTIGYMGGDSHKQDLEMITPVLLSLKEQYSKEINFHFYGVEPPKAFMSCPDTIWTPIKTYVYSNFVQDFQEIDVDIFIAPLVDSEFNRCKSPIKFLEYSACGAPGVFSDIPPYSEIITDGKNGLLAKTSDEWKQQIQLLINNPEIRYKLSVNALKLVQENYLMSQNAEKWQFIYKKVIEHGISQQHNNYIPQAIIESITPQLQEYQIENDNKIAKSTAKINIAEHTIKNLQNETIMLKNKLTSSERRAFTLQNKVNYLSKEVESLEEEVLFYALSNSWRLTRPIRKINRFLKGDYND